MKKHVIVTGGAQGIGKVMSLRLLEESYTVSVWDIDRDALVEMREMHQNDDLFLQEVDVADELSVSNAMAVCVDRFERLDGLVNNAMVSCGKPMEELTLSEWNRVMAVNLTGPFVCCRYAASALSPGGGVIVNICSTRALQSETNTEAYSASKGGLLSLTHAMAMSLGPEIRVNAISPGWIDVSAVRKKAEAKQVKLSEADHSQHPVGRVGRGEDIASMLSFLLNPANSFITGQNFIVDGGMTRKMIYCE